MYIFESFGLGKVIHDDGPDGSSVVSISNSSKSLLTCRIPDLVLNCFVFQMDSFGGKLYSNGWLGIHRKGVLYESGQEVGLAYTRITDHDYLVEEIELLLP